MIVPTKHTSAERSLLAIGGLLLGHLNRPITLNRLWEQVRADPIVRSYDAFTLTLALLYSLGAIEERDGQIARSRA
jgi:hypothetical protein